MPRLRFTLLLATLTASAADGQSADTLAVTPAVVVKGKVRPHLVAVHPAGTLFAYSPDTAGETIRVADVRTGRTAYAVPATGAVECEFTPDGGRLVVLSEDVPFRVEVHDALTGRRLLAFRLAHGEPATPGGRRLLLGGDVLVAPHETNSQPMLFEVGDRLYTSASPSFAGVYDLTTGRRLGKLPGAHVPTRLAVAGDGSALATADAKGLILLYDLKSRKFRREWRSLFDDVSCLAVSRDGRLVAAGSRSGYVRAYAAGTGEDEGARQYTGTRLDALAFAGDGPALYLGAEHLRGAVEDDVHAWRLMTCNWMYRNDYAHVVSPGDAATRKAYKALGPLAPRLVSRDGRVALAAGDDVILRVSLPAIEVADNPGGATGKTAR